jgi:hypothetical protein
LVSGALLIAGCGGGDGGSDPAAAPDTEAPNGVAPDQPTDAADGNESGDAAPVTDPPSTSDDTDAGGADADAALGPELEPLSTFAAPASVLDTIAVSPTGDRVALLWTSDADFSKNLTVFDAATGSELISITDDRLEADVFWTADDRIITAGNFGTVWAWNSATLETVSEAPLTDGSADCSGGNGTVFDAAAGALFLKSDGLCRIDVTTGAVVQYDSERPTTLLAVAIGGNEVYLRGTDDTGALVLRVLDATTLEVTSDEAAASPNPVLAASGNGRVQQVDGGFDYAVEPSGRAVDFYPNGITTSAGGEYYVGLFDGGNVVIATDDGSTIGTIGGGVTRTTWSADDRVLAARTDTGIAVYRLG